MAGQPLDPLGEQLSAYVDGELPPRERDAVDRLLRENPEARRRLEELERLTAGLKALPRRAAPHELASQVCAALERESLLGEAGSGPARTRSFPRVVWPVLALAALLAFSVLIWRALQAPSTVPHGSLVDAQSSRRQEADMPRAGADLSAPPAEERARSIQDRASQPLMEKEAAGLPTRADWTQTPPAPTPAAMAGSRGLVEERLLAAASLEQKIQAGVAPEMLRQHQFDRESCVLTIDCADESQRKSLHAALVTKLKTLGAVNLADTPVVSADSPAYVEGQAGLNYKAANETQLIVRLPREQWEQALSDLQAQPAADGNAEVRAGAVQVSGWTAAKALLGGDEPLAAQPYLAMRESTEGSDVPDSGLPVPDARQTSAEAAVRDMLGVLLAGRVSVGTQAGRPIEEPMENAEEARLRARVVGETDAAPGEKLADAKDQVFRKEAVPTPKDGELDDSALTRDSADTRVADKSAGKPAAEPAGDAAAMGKAPQVGRELGGLGYAEESAPAGRGGAEAATTASVVYDTESAEGTATASASEEAPHSEGKPRSASLIERRLRALKQKSAAAKRPPSAADERAAPAEAQLGFETVVAGEPMHRRGERFAPEEYGVVLQLLPQAMPVPTVVVRFRIVQPSHRVPADRGGRGGPGTRPKPQGPPQS